MTPHITLHADRRVRKRLGLPRKAVEKLAVEAWEGGTDGEQFAGSLKLYLDMLTNYPDDGTKADVKLYNGWAFIFSKGSLVTAFILPEELRNSKAVS